MMPSSAMSEYVQFVLYPLAQSYNLHILSRTLCTVTTNHIWGHFSFLFILFRFFHESRHCKNRPRIGTGRPLSCFLLVVWSDLLLFTTDLYQTTVNSTTIFSSLFLLCSYETGAFFLGFRIISYWFSPPSKLRKNTRTLSPPFSHGFPKPLQQDFFQLPLYLVHFFFSYMKSAHNTSAKIDLYLSVEVHAQVHELTHNITVQQKDCPVTAQLLIFALN